ncbi:MAG: hypothetical protein EA391_03380 [Balneolaceae bacterium]|nr:MAG: hypothetical protein EA391_03380 [Balneolaceae bacterium]
MKSAKPFFISIYFNPFIICGLFAALLIAGCSDSTTEPDPSETFQLISVSVSGTTFSSDQTTNDISVSPTIRIEFSVPVGQTSAQNSVKIVHEDTEEEQAANINLINNGRTIAISPTDDLEYLTNYTLRITDQLESAEGSDFPGAVYNFRTVNGTAEITSIRINDQDIPGENILRNVTYNNLTLEIEFSDDLDTQDYQNYVSISPSFSKSFELSADGKTISITANEPLDYYRHHEIRISSDLEFDNGFSFDEYSGRFQTGLNPEFKFPEISDTELLEKIQRATFGYFWDFAHPQSGMARERNTSGDLVTIGGSGFGLKAILVGIHRGFISRSEGINRIERIVNFLADADRFYGVWPHWMSGSTGKTIAFSQFDDGGDLVETAFMAQGLITVREYLDSNQEQEQDLIDSINHLLDTIEWEWYTRDGQNVLYWHWSENHGWQMNMPITGYNEALIVYILAASSENYGIEPDVYHEGWAQSGSIRNNNSYYGINLPVGFAYGGPLFFAHYSFLGLDPRNLTDTYADYWTQNRNHTLINRQHNIVNPNNFVGYSSDSWGLTASDNFEGYLAHEPNRDNGTITPTAAISSIPYTPEESMEAIRHFYYVLGDKLWGEYGFHDAFNPTEGWWADSYLAIDQGPIIIMIENHRSGLLWDLFMQAPEVQSALDDLGFSY